MTTEENNDDNNKMDRKWEHILLDVTAAAAHPVISLKF